MVLGEVVSEIRRRAEKFPYIIALDGTIGSGKSYEGEKLHEALSPGAVLVPMDLFVRVPRSLWVRKIGEGDIRLRDWYDIGKVRDMLRSVREKKIFGISGLYNIESGEIDNRITIDAERCRYLILEGLFSFDEELDGLIDLRVFVDTSSDVALARAEERDEAKRHLDHYGWLEKKKIYFDGYLPYIEEHRNIADIILDPD
jgi:uridine kinase